MSMMIPQKKMATIIVQSMKNPANRSVGGSRLQDFGGGKRLDSYVDSEKPESDVSMALEHAASRAMRAFESKNVQDLKSALSDFVSLCMSSGDDEEEESEGGDPYEGA